MKSGRYTTELAGRPIEVEVSDRWLSSTAVLYIDGEKMAEGSESLETIDLEHDDVHVRVKTPLSGGVGRCELILADEPDGDDEATEHRVPLEPPAGTRAARLAEFQRQRPQVYAARHVAIAIGQVLVAVVGIGVLVRGLLPRVGLPSIDLPSVDLSWIPDPLGWLFGLLPNVSLSMPGWLDPILATSRYWVPVLIAIGVAMNEVDKRRKANDAKQQRDQPRDQS